MLRVGLTGGLGSGKSTAAQMFAAHGAHVLSADEIGRELMQPGQAVYSAIVAAFGPSIVREDRTLDRKALAAMAFGEPRHGGGRVEELNAIVHPAVIARQAEMVETIAAQHPHAVAVVESALIFEAKYRGGEAWHKRFDRILFVKAPEELRISRFVARSAGGRTLTPRDNAILEAEARRRIAKQAAGERNASSCDYVLINDGELAQLQSQVDALWPTLLAQASGTAQPSPPPRRNE